MKTTIHAISKKLKNNYKSSRMLSSLNHLEQEFAAYTANQAKAKSVKILMTSFSIFHPCFVHDRIISLALRLRGAKIIPFYCDGVQEVECNVSGGVWKLGKNISHACTKCRRASEQLWPDKTFNPVLLSRLVKAEDREEVNALVKTIPNDAWHSFEFDGLSFGAWANDILVNNYVVGNHLLIDGHEELGRSHLRNLLLLYRLYERLLDEKKPDRVVSNDSYYGMWGILQALCVRRSIPFYSHWLGGRQNAWCYAYNDAAMNLDFSKPWQKFASVPLTDVQKARIDEWLIGRREGREMILDTASLAAHQTEHFDINCLDMNKPTVLLTSNVIWDLAALNKQIVFGDMMEWIAETVSWFKEHPQFQLIVKPHPAELNPSIPATNETVKQALTALGIELPQNVFLLSPCANLTVYELFPLIKAGLVHTTTAGIEMSAIGLPVITTARSPYRGFGFTIDPKRRSDYFQNIEDSLTGNLLFNRDLQVELSRKFILFYFAHYYTRINIMDYKWENIPKLRVNSINDLLPGANKHLDYAMDSILQGVPILAEDRWPAES